MGKGRPEASWKYSYYTIKVDGWRFGDTTNTRKQLYIVDTGTTLNYVPPREYLNLRFCVSY